MEKNKCKGSEGSKINAFFLNLDSNSCNTFDSQDEITENQRPSLRVLNRSITPKLVILKNNM